MARAASTKAPAKSKAIGPKGVEPAPAKPALTPNLPAPETIVVRSGRVACDGVGGALGHPRVYLEMGEEDFVECGYCDRRFVLVHELPEDEVLAPGTYEGAAGH